MKVVYSFGRCFKASGMASVDALSSFYESKIVLLVWNPFYKLDSKKLNGTYFVLNLRLKLRAGVLNL